MDSSREDQRSEERHLEEDEGDAGSFFNCY